MTGEELHASDYQMYAYLQTAQDAAAKRLLEALPEIISRFGPGAVAAGHESIRDAMRHYEAAEAVRPAGNDDALLRWNACARLLIRNHADVAVMEERFEPLLE